MAKQQKAPAVPFVHVRVSEPEGIPDGLTAEPKVFKSGKPGYWGQARWTIAGERYIAQLQVVKINGE